MSITTTFKCDRCGHEQLTGVQMWHVAVVCVHFPEVPKATLWPGKVPLWCRACCEQIGLLVREALPKDAAPPHPPTFEDQIRAIIQEEIESAH